MIFRMLPVDADNLTKRWGVDFVQADQTIREKEYSFIHFDLESAKISPINPVPLPKKIPRKKSRTEKIKDSLRDFIN